MVEGRALWIALLMVSGAVAGCFGDKGSDPLEDTGDYPDLTNITSEPPEPEFSWPECTLTGGDIAFPAVPAAPKPATPVMATIKTDAYGVSHVYADDAYSLFFANGYVQARDRLFQMDILRQVGYGESAKNLGAGQLSLDYEVHRTLYTKDEIQAEYDAVPEAAKQIIQAYTDGVNRFMTEAVANDQWPAEFGALGRVPDPWEPTDSVALINYLIGFFGVDGGSELNNLRRLAQLESTLGEEEAWGAFGDWVWLRADDTYTSISPDDLILNGCEDPLERSAVGHQVANMAAAKDAVTFGIPASGVPGIDPSSIPPSPYRPTDHGILRGFHWGSNAMVVDGSLTSTGVPMMWGAPQMGYYKPPVPYQIGLHGAGYDAVGIGVAGAPGMVIGRNADIAWTATSGIEDQVDLVELNLTAARSYEWDGASKDMTCWTVQHQVLPTPADAANAPDLPSAPTTYEQEVCRAEGWPVVAINEAAHTAWIAKSTTRGEELMGALIWLQAPLQHSIDDFRNLMGDFPFTFNYLVASKDGVAHIHTGDVPLRAAGYDPRLPTPAGSAYEWTGEAYTKEMQTWATDPARGYFTSWNNAPVYGWRAGDQPSLWGPVQRVQQIEYWMQSQIDKTGGSLTLEDIKAVNWNAATHDSHALPFMPFLISAAAADPDLADVELALRAWFSAEVPWRDADGDGLYDDPGHAVWDLMAQDLFTRITGDELGDLTKTVHLAPAQGENNGDHGTLNNEMGAILKALQGNTQHDWCDDVTTPGTTETCQEQLTAGLRAAKAALTARHGADVEDWLEPVHMDQFIAFGAFAADERPMINRGSWVQMVSMAESDKSVSVLPPGNSGLITSTEFALATAGVLPEPARLTAELDLYWTNTYKPFPLTAAEVDAVAVTTQTLVVA